MQIQGQPEKTIVRTRFPYLTQEIPHGWDHSTMKLVVRLLQSGISRLLSPYDIGYAMLTSENISDGKLDTSKVKYWYKEDNKGVDLTKYILDDGDILLNFINSISQLGKSCIFQKQNRPWIFTTNVFRIKPDSTKVNSRFFLYFLQSKFIQKRIQAITQPSINQASFTKSDFNKMTIFYPKIVEQQKIASVLSKVDELIQKTDQVIEQTRRLKKGLMQKLLTKGIGHNEFKHTEIGNIPDEWKIVKLHEVSNKIVDGTHFTPSYIKDGIPFLRIKDIQSDNIDWNSVKRISPSEHNELIKRCKPEKGDVLLSKNGTVGITKVIDWDIPFSIFVSLCLIKPKHAIINNNYLSLILSSDVSLRQIRLRSKQGTVTNLHLEEIRELLIPLPPLLEQEKIISALSLIQKKLENENERKHSEENIKRGLMQKLLTGKIRVKV